MTDVSQTNVKYAKQALRHNEECLKLICEGGCLWTARDKDAHCNIREALEVQR